jgi:undecaprenyl-diphosphatase
MIQYLQHTDRDLFLYLNGLHSSFFDFLMWYLTMSLVWLPLYLYFFYIVVKKYRWQVLVILFFAALLILVSDQACNLAKESFHRLRPANDPSMPAVHIVEGYRGGAFGFYSSHASNTFAVAMFLTLIAGKHFRYLALFAFGWAAIMSYSRIYLGVHYPGDILTGAIIGTFFGYWAGRFCVRSMKALHSKFPDRFNDIK